jgi:hypothetical protein
MQCTDNNSRPFLFVFDSNNDWRFVISHWNLEWTGFACQCNYQIRKAVETAGDIDVLLLDKTGTITRNRKEPFYPAKESRKTILSNLQF